jgi:pimeloyl-ACP methyl ester carboxylesterase
MSKTLPIFATPEGRSAYLEAYQAMLDLWPVPFEQIYLSTKYGTTDVNACGPAQAPPLILLHAAGLSSTAWFMNVGDLSRDYRVYAVDVIGDAGKSVADQVMEDRFEYSEWLTDLPKGGQSHDHSG